MKILNFKKYGIKTKIEDSGVNEVIFDNIYLRNDSVEMNSLAIYNNANDCKFSNIIIRDSHYAILTTTAFFDYVHGWIGLSDLIPDSYFLKTTNNLVIADNMYADTYQYPFISTFGSLNITNALILNNSNIYNSQLQNTNKPVLFKSELDLFNLNTYGYFKVVNSQINTTNYDSVDLTNRYNVNNIFENNYYTNLNKLSNKQYFSISNNKGNFIGSANNLFTNGSYSTTADNSDLPGSYFFGILTVDSTTNVNGAYISNSNIDNITYCRQIFTTSETIPKIYIRMYTKSSNWTNWIKVTTSNI